MIYAIDTNIIYDILLADPAFGPSSRDFVTELYANGHSLIACDVVWAEASAGFADKAAFRRQMAAFGIDFSPMPEAATIRAGEIWKNARLEAARLLTRDRGFMRRWFSNLKIVDPSAH